jgi:heterotetrameric sarcosine oxidase delta subunit
MSFLVPCPTCGPRDVNEFAYAGEVASRPTGAPSLRELTSYLYFKRNAAGIQREWWYHRFGCRQWFQAERDTRTNTVLKSEIAGPLGERSGAPTADTPAT